MKHPFSLVFLSCFLVACASDPPAPPPPLPPTVLQLHLEVGSDVNSANQNEASPVILRIYELKEISGFNATDFFALFNDDKSVLGGDLMRKSELILKPGESKDIEIEPGDDAQALGLFAAFRQLDNAQWRSSVKIEAHQKQSIIIKLKRNKLAVELPR